MTWRTATPFLDEVLGTMNSMSANNLESLFGTSDALLASFKEALQQPPHKSPSMIPSFTSALPNGSESGTAVAMDLGGSTLRVSVIRLRPHRRLPGSDAPHLGAVMETVARRSQVVGDAIKRLPAAPFFDWIAAAVSAVVAEAGLSSPNLPLGVTWSFPVEPTSAASGLVREMGKGYEQWREIGGTDLRTHMEAGLRRAGLPGVRMAALMNDTEATLLSHAYANPATRISLIWGTGLNAAVYLPLAALGPAKLERHPAHWRRAARAAVVNTEASTFGGGGLLPLVDADVALDAASLMPGFQPLEQLTSGRYLGEIVRRVLVDAVRRDALFAGALPAGMDAPWSLDTALASAFEDPQAAPLDGLVAAFGFATPPTPADARYVRAVCDAVSSRAAALLAVTVFSLFRLQRDSHPPAKPSPAIDHDLHDAPIAAPVAVAYCGAVAEKHATARGKCQAILDRLVAAEPNLRPGEPRRRLVLEAAADSGLLGAAVGAVMNDQHTEIRARL